MGTATINQELTNNHQQNYVDPIVVHSAETNQNSESHTSTYQCRYCPKSYKRFGNLKNHEIVCSKK